MKNYVATGDTITAPAPAGGVVSGDGALIGALFGIAAFTAAVGVSCEFKTCGSFEMPKPGSQAWAIGDLIYFDESAGTATTDDDTGSNLLIGCAVSVVGSGADETVGVVRLNGVTTA